MPSSILSHQAPALIIKIKYPKKFDGTALCISTIIPDIDLILRLFIPINLNGIILRGITHSLLGLVLITMPLTVILTIVFCSYLGPFFANLAKKNNIFIKPLKFFGIDEWDSLNKKKYNRKFFIVASYSALIGGFTHLLLDLPAHGTIELFFPLILQSPDFLLCSIVDFGPIFIGEIQIERNLTVFRLIWISETIIFGVISLYLLRYIKKHELISKWYEKI
ncbi:MAG: DUF4184 family protein [Candidatus Odinarchaeota archaeon]